MAEQSGLIHQLQNIVLEQSCQLLIKLREKKLLPSNFRLSINISPLQFENNRLTDHLSWFLTHYRLNPSLFTLEITEGLLMDEKADTHNQMQALRQQGFRFAIDDFGTGYSSLAYLHRLPVDQLKIDKLFIRELGEDPVGEAIVNSVSALAVNLGFEVIAEGVELKLQADILQQKSLTGLQGFFYARPMTAEDLTDYLTSGLRF